MRLQRTQSILQALALALLLVIVGMPLGACLLETLRLEESQGRATFVDLGARSYLINGLKSAVGAALLAGVAGAALAVARLPKGGRWVVLAGMIPLILPPTVYGLSWNALWAIPESEVLALARVVLALGLAYTPLVFLIVLAAQSLQDPAMDEAARLAGLSPIRRLFRIRLQALLPSASAGALAVFLLSFSSFEIPSALSWPSFPEAVYQRFQQTNTLGAPAGLAIAGALPALVLAWLCWRRFSLAPGKPLAFRLMIEEERLVVSWLVWILFITVAAVLPLAGLMHRVDGQVPLSAMRPDLVAGLRDTLPVVLSALVALLLLGWVLADLVVRSRVAALVVLVLVLLGMGLAPAVVGVGLIRAWIAMPEGGFIYGTNLAYVLALLARYLALPVLVFAAARRILPDAFEDSARLAGLGYLRRQLRLMMPVLALSWVALGASALAFMLGELGATTLLSAPGTELLSFRLHSRIHIGPESYVAAFSLQYALVVLALAALFWWGGQWVTRARRNL